MSHYPIHTVKANTTAHLLFLVFAPVQLHRPAVCQQQVVAAVVLRVVATGGDASKLAKAILHNKHNAHVHTATGTLLES